MFHEPHEDFLKRVKSHKMKPAPSSEITPVLGKRDDRDELVRSPPPGQSSRSASPS